MSIIQSASHLSLMQLDRLCSHEDQLLSHELWETTSGCAPAPDAILNIRHLSLTRHFGFQRVTKQILLIVMVETSFLRHCSWTLIHELT